MSPAATGDEINLKEHLKKSNIAKIAAVLLALDLILSLYIMLQISKYMGTVVLLASLPVILLIVALLLVCNLKKTKATLIIEAIFTVILIIAMVIVGRISSLAGAIGRTVQYEVVQIVALKDSDINEEDDFSTYTLGYTNSDDGAYQRSSEILVENNKKVKESHPYP